MVIRSNFPRSLIIKSSNSLDAVSYKLKSLFFFNLLYFLGVKISVNSAKFGSDLALIGLRLREFLINVPGNHKMRLSCRAIISGSLVEFLYFCVDGYQTGL